MYKSLDKEQWLTDQEDTSGIISQWIKIFKFRNELKVNSANVRACGLNTATILSLRAVNMAMRTSNIRKRLLLLVSSPIHSFRQLPANLSTSGQTLAQFSRDGWLDATYPLSQKYFISKPPSKWNKRVWRGMTESTISHQNLVIAYISSFHQSI